MLKIIQNHKACIGCGTCVAFCPKFWEMNEQDGKARLKKGKMNKEKDKYELEIENTSEQDLKCNQLAADNCPIQIISIE